MNLGSANGGFLSFQAGGYRRRIATRRATIAPLKASTLHCNAGFPALHSTTLKISREPDSTYGMNVSYHARHSGEPVTFFISCSNEARPSN